MNVGLPRLGIAVINIILLFNSQMDERNIQKLRNYKHSVPITELVIKLSCTLEIITTIKIKIVLEYTSVYYIHKAISHK